MPDNSARLVHQGVFEVPRGGRPHSIRRKVPYRIEEWGKGKDYYLPEGKDGPRTPKRGPPSCGTLAVYIGEETKLPRKEFVVQEGQSPISVVVVEEDFAYSKWDARRRADAYIRRRMMEQIGRARRRAAKRR